MSTDTKERVNITPEQLDSMMPEGDRVHTLIQTNSGMLLGADWDRKDILEAAQRGAELSGGAATALKHGAVVWLEDGTPLFVETKQP